jgi:recombinational DNA repair protein RecR
MSSSYPETLEELMSALRRLPGVGRRAAERLGLALLEWDKEELHQLFFDLRDRMGQTFVIVTHDEGLASLTDRTIHMKDGKIID